MRQQTISYDCQEIRVILNSRSSDLGPWSTSSEPQGYTERPAQANEGDQGKATRQHSLKDQPTTALEEDLRGCVSVGKKGRRL